MLRFIIKYLEEKKSIWNDGAKIVKNIRVFTKTNMAMKKKLLK